MPTVTRCSDHRLLRGLLIGLSLSLASAGAAAASNSYHYLLHCSGCHLETGVGMVGVVPDLKEALGYFAGIPEGRDYLIRVPGSSQSPLNDAELADLLTWMVATFSPNPAAAPFTAEEVAAHRSITLYDPQAARRALLAQRPGTPLTGKPAPASEGIDTSGTPVEAPVATPTSGSRLAALGERLFFDTALSRHGNQACASCHDPARAFADSRPLALSTGGSLGSDETSLGHRNAPSLTYVALGPEFTVDPPSALAADANPADRLRGGFFWDGRAATVQEQVLAPFVDPREMGLADLDELAARVLSDPRYRDDLAEAKTPAAVVQRIADALAAYLRSDVFNRFDSRYDRYVRGEVKPTRQEVVGMGLFFSTAFTSCSTCHQSESVAYAARELFTNHRYENIGTPIHPELMARNGLGSDFRDTGLALNARAQAVAQDAGIDPRALPGRFKVPGLRNVAVTGPYMHNGTFDELATVLLFYNHFNETGHSGLIDPETGAPWAPADHPDGVVTSKLRSGFPLSPAQISALTAFLRMLTDQPYEHLLD